MFSGFFCIFAKTNVYGNNQDDKGTEVIERG